MSEDLTAKQRDTAFRHWSSQIAREGRDMAGLERIAARALQDRAVRADAPLQNMIRAELERQRAELQRETQRQTRLDQQSHATTTPGPHYDGSPSPRDTSGAQLASEGGAAEVRSPPPAAPAVPPPASPAADADQAAFGLATEQLSVALKAGDQDAAQTACEIIRALHERRGDIVSAGDMAKCEQCVAKWLAELAEHRYRVAALAAEAVTAARNGDAAAVASLIRRLDAIHAAHPRLLDEAGLQQMHVDVAHASEKREDVVTTRKLMDRERAVAGEMRRLASAVFDFHAAVFGHPGSRAQFRRAARVYLRALRQTRLLGKDWLAEFVLELGDVLANWNAPPPGAEEQIDKFLERLRQALLRINAKMSEISAKRDEIVKRDESRDV